MVRISIEVIKDRFLKEFTFQRLTEEESNKEKITDFKCDRNDLLAKHLIHYAWKKDQDGETAYYLVKDISGKVVFYFSVKCGLLSQKIEEKYIKLLEFMTDNVESFQDYDLSILAKIAEKLQVPCFNIIDSIYALQDKAEQYQEDKRISQGLDIIRVNQTYSAIELVQFCANNNYKSYWTELAYPLPMGVCVFWFFIVPLVLEIQKKIGCRYLYLFAADDTEDLELCNYYNNDLGFRKVEEISVLKPRYDYTCIPMFQEINNLMRMRDERISYLLTTSSGQ